MTVNDINVDAKFQLRALRDDYVHAFVTYFIAEFTACSQKTAISTGRIALELERRSLSISLLAPGGGYTHWKQTVFYFPDYATIKRDETLEGTFSCKVHLENTVGRRLSSSMPSERHLCLFARKSSTSASTFNSKGKYPRWIVRISIL